MRMCKILKAYQKGLPHGRHNDYILVHMDRNLTLTIVSRTELKVRKGSVAYGLEADISIPHCLLWVDRYLKAAKDQNAELV